MQHKVAFIDQGETLGGAERFLLDFLGALTPGDKLLLQPLVIGAESESYQSSLQKAQIPFSTLTIPSVRSSWWQKPFVVLRLVKTAWQLSRLLQKTQTQTVLTNTPRAHFVVYVAQKLGFTRVRWVSMWHDFTTPEPLMQRIGRVCDQLVANGIPIRNQLKSTLNQIDQTKIRIVENGVDLAKVPESSTPTYVETVGILGRIDPRKGQTYAVQAADLLLERNPDLRFQIIGEAFGGDQRTLNYEREIRAIQSERNLTNLTFKPATKTPWEAFGNFDLVLVLPTEPETFGRVVIEALAMGRLVLAFDQTGPREILDTYLHWVQQKHGLSSERSRILIEPNNAMSLAESIGEVADRPEPFTQIFQHGPAFVAEQYPQAETQKRLRSILTSAIEEL